MANPPEAGPEVGESKAVQSDKQLRRALSQWDIAFLVIGAMIGSGWLFGSLGAASTAGPAAILSWLIAGFLMIFIALAYAEIGGMLPKSGGIVRYPQYTHGGFASFIMGWAYFLSAVTVAPSEAIAAVTYMSSYLPQLMSNGLLTPLGTLVAAVLVVFFFFLNWYGVHVMGKTNTGVGWWKLIIPSLTFILLMALAMHTVNFSGLLAVSYRMVGLRFS
ncbi:APC family permease [Vulcanisaeta distributa]|uniref:APC family permease n=1 Tax=Vulcanisaeta distributa TaxID=164451 RepID=UPI000A583D1B|nr:APC family permease [Vulcanisaeta distributa]